MVKDMVKEFLNFQPISLQNSSVEHTQVPFQRLQMQRKE